MTAVAAEESVVVPPTVLPVAGGSATFQVRRIYCVGRNYLDHPRDEGIGRARLPFFFQKPTDAICPSRRNGVLSARYPLFPA